MFLKIICMKNSTKSFLNSALEFLSYKTQLWRKNLNIYIVFYSGQYIFLIQLLIIFTCWEGKRSGNLGFRVNMNHSQLFVAHDAAICRDKIQLLHWHRSLGRTEAQRLKEFVCTLVFHPFLHLLKTNETSSFVHKGSFLLTHIFKRDSSLGTPSMAKCKAEEAFFFHRCFQPSAIFLMHGRFNISASLFPSNVNLKTALLLHVLGLSFGFRKSINSMNILLN